MTETLESETLSEGGHCSWTLSHRVYIACCLCILRVRLAVPFPLCCCAQFACAPLQFLKKAVPSSGIAEAHHVSLQFHYFMFALTVHKILIFLLFTSIVTFCSEWFLILMFLFWVVAILISVRWNPIVLFVFLNSDGGHFSYSLWSFLFPLLKKMISVSTQPTHIHLGFFWGGLRQDLTRSARMAWNHFKFLPLFPQVLGL